MSKQLTVEQYYLVLAWYMLASQAQAEVMRYEKMISAFVKDGKLNDAIYDPTFSGTKEEYDRLLLDSGIEIIWNPKTEVKKDV